MRQEGLKTMIKFLITRVKEPTKDYWGKLKWVIKYNKETINLFLTIKPKSFKPLMWIINGANAMYPDCKGHTGIMLTLGDIKGAVISYSWKQKLNSQSLRETKFISVED